VRIRWLSHTNKLIGIRDPHGIRPLCIGRIDDSYVLASETCALDAVDAEYVRDVNPGEIIVIEESGMTSIQTEVPERRHFAFLSIFTLQDPTAILTV